LVNTENFNAAPLNGVLLEGTLELFKTLGTNSADSEFAGVGVQHNPEGRKEEEEKKKGGRSGEEKVRGRRGEGEGEREGRR
jgi:hypothetical protein